MKVFVIGGTGAMGSHAVPALIGAGHRVTALARTPEKAATLTAQGAAPVSVSIFDRDQLSRAVEGHDAIVNLASSIPSIAGFVRRSAWRDNDRVRHDGSANVVDAAIAAGVGRLVQESVSMIYPDRGSNWIDECVPPDSFPMALANLAAEASAARFADAGGIGTVLRFGWFYGCGAHHSEQLFWLARHRLAVMVGAADTYVSSIHLDDGATAVTAAIHAPSGAFNIVDDQPLTKREYADALSSATTRAAWLRAPGRSALLLGDRLTSLTRSLRVSNRSFRDQVGWSPRYPSAREGWIATAAELRRRSLSPA